MLGNKKKLYIPEDTMFDPIAPKGIVSYVARISPSDAKQLLSSNENNRQPSDVIIQKYRSDMENGVWQDSASQVQISKQGKLLNGQHRLRAIVESNTSQILTITEGLSKECFSVMDIGKGRTAKDALSILKVKNFKAAASIIRFYILWRDGIQPKDMKKDQSSKEGNIPMVNRLTTNARFKGSSKAEQIRQVLEFALENPNIEDIALKSTLFYSKFKYFPASSLGGFLIHASKLGYETKVMAEEFLQKLTSGVGLVEGDPILYMRMRIYKWVDDREWQVMGQGYKYQILLMTWNAYVSGKVIDRYKVKESDPVDMNPVLELSEEAA